MQPQKLQEGPVRYQLCDRPHGYSMHTQIHGQSSLTSSDVCSYTRRYPRGEDV